MEKTCFNTNLSEKNLFQRQKRLIDLKFNRIVQYIFYFYRLFRSF